jgi:mono/diheme cytochrome c family protein
MKPPEGASGAGAQPSGEAGAGGTAAGEGGANGAGDAGETSVDPVAARGQYLVDHVIACSDCHTPRNEMGAPIAAQYMAGVECFIRLESGECLHSRNLTNDETGLKNRTDDEIKAMIRDGVRPSAAGEEALHPVMPYYVFANMKDEDLDAIVAYLRTVPAVEHSLPQSDEVFELPAPANPIDPETIPMPADDYPEYDDAVAGRYLAAQSGLCMECHTPHEMGPDVLLPENFFAGGEAFELGLPVVPRSKNLTSDPETGLGEWTVDEIVTAIKEGKDKNGDGICPPMPAGMMAAYGGLTDADALAIAHYLKSLPPKENEVEDMCTWPPM